MAANKGKKGKGRKSPPSRKSRLWLRDLLNLLGGLLVGAAGIWVLQEFLESRAAGAAGARYRAAIQQDLPALDEASERYEALSEQAELDSQALEGLEIDVPLYGVDAYEGIRRDLPDLEASVRPELFAFYLHLRDAELLRKLIVDQREHPEQMPQILTREFLRTLHEGSLIAPRLLWALGPEE